MFTTDELKNLLAIINIAPIKGSEAVTVALLQQKVAGLLSKVEVPVDVKQPEPEKKK